MYVSRDHFSGTLIYSLPMCSTSILYSYKGKLKTNVMVLIPSIITYNVVAQNWGLQVANLILRT